MQLCKLNYEKILTLHTHILTRRKRERRKKRLNINSRALDNDNVFYLSGSSFLSLRLDFSAGRRVYERAREILSQL